MKFISIFILTCLATPVLAADRDLYDLQYFPKAGTFFGASAIHSYSGGMEFNSDQPGVEADGDINGSSVEQTLGYSVTDNFLLSATGTYSHFKIETEVQSGGVLVDSDSSTNKGWQDPSVQAKLRLMDQDLRLDLIGGGRIPSGDARSFSSHSNLKGENNPFFTGGPSLYAGFDIGQKQEDIQLSFLALLERAFKSKEHDGDVITKNDAHNRYLFQVSMLNKFQESFLVRAFFSTRFVNSYDFTDNVDGKAKSNPFTIYKLGGAGEFLINENLLAEAGLSYNQYNFASSIVDRFYFWDFHVGLRYQL